MSNNDGSNIMGLTRPAEREKLSDREKLFAIHYIVHKFNAKAAYLEISPNSKDPKRAGKRMKDRPRVAEYIKDLTLNKFHEVTIKAEDIIKEEMIMAFSDIRNYIEFGMDEVVIKSSKTMGDETKAIKKLKSTPVFNQGEFAGNKIEIELYDKQSPLINLGKCIGMFKDKLELTIDNTQQQASDEGYNMAMERVMNKRLLEAKDVTEETSA